MSKHTNLLSQILANTYALAVKTHAAHWNVTGAQFFSLHAAFGASMATAGVGSLGSAEG